MFYATDDLRIKGTKVVLPPVFLEEELPMTDAASATVFGARKAICEVLAGHDKRLIVVVGPCSIHDTKAAREYAAKLKEVSAEVANELMIVMRVYFEKPRTTIGWKGLINDPYLNQSYKINDGLRLARRLLLDLAEMGVPAGTEFLDMISPQYVAALVSWGAIGARTTESQIHRQLAVDSPARWGLRMRPRGTCRLQWKQCSRRRIRTLFWEHSKYGQSAILFTSGNPDTHVILRGGNKMVNYTAEAVAEVCG